MVARGGEGTKGGRRHLVVAEATAELAVAHAATEELLFEVLHGFSEFPILGGLPDVMLDADGPQEDVDFHLVAVDYADAAAAEGRRTTSAAATALAAAWDLSRFFGFDGRRTVVRVDDFFGGSRVEVVPVELVV